jgi:pyruvate/2-oxoacid:ferredoxin oxidoreductase alpha subunit
MLHGVKKVAMVDRNVSLGGSGIFGTELRSALYGSATQPDVHGFIAGLGGQDLTPDVLGDIVERTLKAERPSLEPTWIGILPDKEEVAVQGAGTEGEARR